MTGDPGIIKWRFPPCDSWLSLSPLSALRPRESLSATGEKQKRETRAVAHFVPRVVPFRVCVSVAIWLWWSKPFWDPILG